MLIGLYEKALPKSCSWQYRLEKAKEWGFGFLEISIDESDERLARLDWSSAQKYELLHLSRDINIPISSMCLSGHRKYAYGSSDKNIVKKAREIFDKALDFALFCGVRNIQLAGYDVYYEDSTPSSKQQFKDELALAVEKAAANQVMLSIEIMDHPFMSSITRFADITKDIHSPWLTVYPDVGNLTAWWNNIPEEFSKYIHRISAIHLKDTLPVSPRSQGVFRDLQLGQGTVDFNQVFSILKELNYQGAFVIELWGDPPANAPANFDAEQNILHAQNFILQKMKETQYL
ncbi:MAG: L-ribulose-5-phosphate 3-epimerase [Brevinema sp.]